MKKKGWIVVLLLAMLFTGFGCTKSVKSVTSEKTKQFIEAIH